MFPSPIGIGWCSRWNVTGEGPYSLAAKILNANDLKSRYFRSVICWKSSKRVSLLDPRPTGSTIEPAATLGRILHDASLSARIPHLYSELADDQTLRYCAKCMAIGFQAAIAQIQGIERCPIHGEIHRNTCIRCGSKTPPYFLQDGSIPGFSCRTCGAPFGGDIAIDRRLDVWTSPDNLHRLDPIHRWLTLLGNSKGISWINVSEWNATRISPEADESNRREAVFAALSTRLAESGVPESNQAQKLNALGPFRLDSNRACKDLAQNEYDEVLQRLTIPNAIHQYRQNFLVPSFGVPVPIDPVVPPELHAHLIWRAQFEWVSSTHSQLYSRIDFSRNVIPDLLNTGKTTFEFPLDDRALRDGVLKAVWVAALKIAIEWHQKILFFQRQDFPPADHHWLTSVDRWAGRLGCWKDRRYFPVGVITVTDRESGENQLYFVVA